ncbi:F-box protein CPR1-like [Papaver somniferum]|uniref:F-box protein CPR1-like n=1 Tax=Papaver somniferum TaxID=3469 RepID=UPI000E700BB0|nr:F-box protein CPR1-like [Papaver somniferum]
MHINHFNHPSPTDYEIFYYFEYDKNHDESITPVEGITKMNFTLPFKSYFRFIGSCQGLICLVKGRSVICNPITREYVMLPEIKGDWYDSLDLECIWMCGFCYVSSTDDYKVLRIYGGTKPWKVYIYTLGSDSGWRKLEEFDSTYNFHHLNDAGTIANECFYWMDDELKMIGTFDFIEEKFCEYLSPPPLPPHRHSDWCYSHIGVLDGFLYFISNLNINHKFRDLWLLKTKNDIGLDENQSLGWSQEFRIDRSILLAVAKKYGAFNLYWYHLNSYDINASTSERLVELKERKCRLIAHKKSLVSFKELGERDTQTMEQLKETRKP